MIKASVTIDEVLTILNEAHADDPKAMDALIKARVNCNDKLADHPTIQIGVHHNGYSVGLLGILNGLFGIDSKGSGCIAASYDGDKLIGFIKRNQ